MKTPTEEMKKVTGKFWTDPQGWLHILQATQIVCFESDTNTVSEELVGSTQDRETPFLMEQSRDFVKINMKSVERDGLMQTTSGTMKQFHKQYEAL